MRYFPFASLSIALFSGTFRPERIRSIAERFGLNADEALNNILHGLDPSLTAYMLIIMLFKREHSIPSIRYA